MTRSLLILSLVLMSGSLCAGEYADAVKELGDKNLRTSAIEKLANAGADAFEDLLEGLKQNPDAEGIDAEEAAERSARRLECARLLGTVADTRASADLMQILGSQAVASPKYPWLGAACASALGRLWSEKEAGADRNEVARALLQYATDVALDKRLRWGCLHGLAAMKTGGDPAALILVDDKADDLLRSAAIEVIVATKRKASADDLLNLWDTQRFGPKGEDGTRKGAEAKDYSKPLGLQALFALAELGDKRAVAGLVDVTTMNEFANFSSLRDEAVRQMKTKALSADAISGLVTTFKDVDKPTQRTRAAQTLGDLGAVGVTAFLDVADDEAPKPKEGEPADKYPADYFAKQVDMNLTNLRSDDALNAFVEAYGKLPADSKSLREKIVDHLLNNRNSLKDSSVNLFRTAADDETLEAAKRANAVNAWAEAKGKEAFDDLTRWVKSADGVIRAQAVQNLGRTYIPLAKSLPLLKEALADKGENFSKARENALQGLQRSDDKELLPLFIDSLDPAKETNADVRNAALKAIEVYRRNARVEDDKVYPAVKARVSDTDANVRATAVAKAANMALLMGNKTDAVDIVHTALTDSSDEVRLQAYGQVVMMSSDLDAAKVMDAALKEDKPDMKGHAVNAAAKLNKDSFGTDTEKQKLLVNMAMSVIEDRSREAAAKELIGKLGEGTLFNYVSEKLRTRIDELTTGERKEYAKVPVLIRTLIVIQDNTYFTRVQELAEIPNVELRRACVEYIRDLGTKKEVPFLRTLGDKTDAAAAALKPEIDSAIQTLQDR
jgi:hypothetical protein